MRDREDREIQDQRSAARASGTLVFSTVVGTDELGLDCMWDVPHGQAALPGRITAVLPDCTRATKQVTGLIDRWLEDGEVIAVWITPEPTDPLVKLTADRTTITLPLGPDVPTG